MLPSYAVDGLLLCRLLWLDRRWWVLYRMWSVWTLHIMVWCAAPRKTTTFKKQLWFLMTSSDDVGSDRSGPSSALTYSMSKELEMPPLELELRLGRKVWPIRSWKNEGVSERHVESGKMAIAIITRILKNSLHYHWPHLRYVWLCRQQGDCFYC